MDDIENLSRSTIKALGKKIEAVNLLRSLQIPTPKTYVLRDKITKPTRLDKKIEEVIEVFGENELIAIRPTNLNHISCKLPSFLFVGISDINADSYSEKLGRLNYLKGYCSLIRKVAVEIMNVDSDIFDDRYYRIINSTKRDMDSGRKFKLFEEVLKAYKEVFLKVTGEPFPDDRRKQLKLILGFFFNKWHIFSRSSSYMNEEFEMGLLLQVMVNSSGVDQCSGKINFIEKQSGKRTICGFIEKGIAGEIFEADRLSFSGNSIRDESKSFLNLLTKEHISKLQSYNAKLERELKDTFELDICINNSELTVLNFRSSEKSVRAVVQLAVDLVSKGFITKEEALLRVDPLALTEYLHPQIEETDKLESICKGLPASPGAANGKIVFTANLALELTSRGENVILVTNETGPEDIKGMQISKGVLTVRGGMTSHAALIARGLGIPGVVGAIDLRINFAEKTLSLKSGDKLFEGDEITINGSNGDIIRGKCKTKAPELTGAFSDLLSWADEYRSLKVRANADTPEDAALARKFNVDGIGLCRTEHMFFQKDRLLLMQEMIFTENKDQRLVSLEKLRPIQREDFIQLFEVMSGQPVAIRLLDPPLHEFLPKNAEQLSILAKRIGVEFNYISRRSRELREFNPMLGHRGVRLGITMPEIYQMQVRAIFEATSHVLKSGTGLVIPEIMFPLVSANKEIELLRKIIEESAEYVYQASGVEFSYKVGAMIETPRAALRAGDIAEATDFISFGTNDLTQMTYGLSRDDAGKFLNDYINSGVFDEDPFLSLDKVGVGELMSLAVERGRSSNKNLSIALCGEHGGDPESIFYCKSLGLHYVSCSPYRVPIARLAAAQADIAESI